MSQLAMELKAQQDIELLRQQLSAAAREILALRAASQAREQQYRGALVIADNAGDDEWHPYSPDQAKRAINEALSIPTDPTALEAMIQKATIEYQQRLTHALGLLNAESQIEAEVNLREMIAKAGEVMRERFMRARGNGQLYPVEIRAMPGVTLEDLKK